MTDNLWYGKAKPEQALLLRGRALLMSFLKGLRSWYLSESGQIKKVAIAFEKREPHQGELGQGG